MPLHFMNQHVNFDQFVYGFKKIWKKGDPAQVWIMCLYIWQHFIDLITITVASWNKLYPNNNNKAVTQRFSVNFMGSRKSLSLQYTLM